MKKNLLNTLAGLLICSAVAFSQPVLTATGINPVIGDVLTLKYGNFVSPGNSGPNQNWNLAGMTATSTSNYTVATVASAPNSSSFTANSNMQMNDGTTYSFYNASATAFQNSGTIGGGIAIVYSNNEDLIRYPFNANDNYSDSWVANFTANSIGFARTGTSVVTYDGYGTLVLPTGTFNNVARVHFVQNYEDVSQFGTITYNNDQYLWFINGHHQPIAGVFSVTINGSGNPTTGGYYSNASPLATAIAKQKNDFSNVVCFPNPAEDVLNFNLKNSALLLSINLYDNNGNLVYSGKGENSNENIISINTGELANGIYLAQLIADDGSTGTKIININR